MSQTVVGLFDRYVQANQALEDLYLAGYSQGQISLITHHDNDRSITGYKSNRSEPPYAEDALEIEDGEITAGKGAVVGGVTGLLIGLGTAMIPGIGPILAAGPIGAAVGAGVGAIAGPLIDGLVQFGMPEDDAQFYADGIREGGTLIAVHVEGGDAEEVRDIFNRNGAVQVQQDEDGMALRSMNNLGGRSSDVSVQDEAIIDRRESRQANYDRLTSDGSGTGIASIDAWLESSGAEETRGMLREGQPLASSALEMESVRETTFPEPHPTSNRNLPPTDEESRTLHHPTPSISQQPTERAVTVEKAEGATRTKAFERTNAAERGEALERTKDSHPETGFRTKPKAPQFTVRERARAKTPSSEADRSTGREGMSPKTAAPSAEESEQQFTRRTNKRTLAVLLLRQSTD